MLTRGGRLRGPTPAARLPLIVMSPTLLPLPRCESDRARDAIGLPQPARGRFRRHATDAVGGHPRCRQVHGASIRTHGHYRPDCTAGPADPADGRDTGLLRFTAWVLDGRVPLWTKAGRPTWSTTATSALCAIRISASSTGSMRFSGMPSRQRWPTRGAGNPPRRLVSGRHSRDVHRGSSPGPPHRECDVDCQPFDFGEVRVLGPVRFETLTGGLLTTGIVRTLGGIPGG